MASRGATSPGHHARAGTQPPQAPEPAKAERRSQGPSDGRLPFCFWSVDEHQGGVGGTPPELPVGLEVEFVQHLDAP